jgi:hypothetical protein
MYRLSSEKVVGTTEYFGIASSVPSWDNDGEWLDRFLILTLFEVR